MRRRVMEIRNIILWMMLICILLSGLCCCSYDEIRVNQKALDVWRSESANIKERKVAVNNLIKKGMTHDDVTKLLGRQTRVIMGRGIVVGTETCRDDYGLQYEFYDGFVTIYLETDGEGVDFRERKVIGIYVSKDRDHCPSEYIDQKNLKSGL